MFCRVTFYWEGIRLFVQRYMRGQVSIIATQEQKREKNWFKRKEAPIEHNYIYTHT